MKNNWKMKIFESQPKKKKISDVEKNVSFVLDIWPHCFV